MLLVSILTNYESSLHTVFKMTFNHTQTKDWSGTDTEQRQTRQELNWSTELRNPHAPVQVKSSGDLIVSCNLLNYTSRSITSILKYNICVFWTMKLDGDNTKRAKNAYS